MSSKVSKDSDCGLESNKNFSKTLPSNSLDLGPGEVGQGGKEVFHSLTSLTKNQHPPTKKLFSSAD